MDKSRIVLVGCMVALFTTLAMGEGAQTSPTPYPDQGNEAAWPGKGPIRVFQWMVDNRNYYWTQREKDQKSIVLAGDSLTFGWRESGKEYYPNQDHQLANRGIGGDVTRGLLFRFKEDVLDLQPTAVVLLIGSNDLSAHANPADIAANITTMIQQAAAYNPKLPIILCTIPPRNHPKAPTKPGALADTNKRIAAIAAEHDTVHLLDLFSALALNDGSPDPQYFGEDQLHMSPKGYQKWAEMLKASFASLKID